MITTALSLLFEDLMIVRDRGRLVRSKGLETKKAKLEQKI
jgi:hypothetical protein